MATLVARGLISRRGAASSPVHFLSNLLNRLIQISSRGLDSLGIILFQRLFDHLNFTFDLTLGGIANMLTLFTECFFGGKNERVGLIAGFSEKTGLLSTEVRLLLATGFCGGFTTMSSFVYELGQFVQDKEYFFASSYFVLTLAGAGLAFALGLLLTELILR